MSQDARPRIKRKRANRATEASSEAKGFESKGSPEGGLHDVHAVAGLAAAICLLFGTFADAGKPPTMTTGSVSAPPPAVGTVTVTARGTGKKLARLKVHLDGNLGATCTATPCNYPWNS